MQSLYICVFAVIVGSLAEAGYWLRDDATLEQVKKAVVAANDYLKNHNLANISTPDLSYDSFYGSGRITKAHFGDLSTIVVSGEDQTFNKTELDATVYFFDVNLGLEEFLVSYDFKYSFLYILRGSGHAEITAKNNKVQLTGTITKSKDSNCKGVLRNAAVTELGQFSAEIKPQTIFSSLVAKVITFAKNHFLPSDIPVFNKLITEALGKQAFQDEFSKVVCLSV
uniref:Uncharacterized protein n=1 Tax=Riptortus pedestris TaxID=329032 RepID=R4WHT4_RIPPE|nr:unknown secreted protein [Riptortus pedestris]